MTWHEFCIRCWASRHVRLYVELSVYSSRDLLNTAVHSGSVAWPEDKRHRRTHWEEYYVIIGVARRGPAGAKESGKNLHNRFSCTKGTNRYVKILCLVIVNVNVTKYMPQKCQIGQICGYQVCFFQALNYSKTRFRQGRSPRTALGGAYDASPGPLVGWGGRLPLPIPFLLDAFGVSIVRPPKANSGYA